jgi:hypothetical protein
MASLGGPLEKGEEDTALLWYRGTSGGAVRVSVRCLRSDLLSKPVTSFKGRSTRNALSAG